MAGTPIFPTVRSEGGLLPPDLLARIVQNDKDLGGFDSTDYALGDRERIGDAIARGWKQTQSFWAAFQAATDGLPETESGVTETREQWILPLLRRVLAYEPHFEAAAEEVAGHKYLVSHRDGPLAIHVVSFRDDLDHPAPRTEGERRMSPHALLQELLNRSDRYSYGLVSNGFVIRLLRDSHSLTRFSYVEFDLKSMLEAGVYADFVLLWLILHRSRLPREGVDLSDSWLEKWRERAESQGTRARGELRRGVAEALKELGTGLLAHPANERLRERLRRGDLSTMGFYAQLLRMLYRLIFLLVVEERDLVFPDGAGEAERRRYAEYYGLNRLRELTHRLADDERHDDLWRGLMLVFAILAGRKAGLGLPSLGGGLFAIDTCPDLDGNDHAAPALISNGALARALDRLSRVQVSEGSGRGRGRKLWRRVSYRDMDVEELGGIYEGLLDQQPRVVADAANSHFELVGSGERKQTGSYYTPTSLVQELIKSALEPVIAERLAAARAPADREAALLGITVCDAAAGSGHFLLAAARRLADELARVRALDREPSLPEKRRALRDVIRHCIYGVDVNPLAVDLCKLTLWLEAHEGGRPLSFLDHHVKLGNSLIGAMPELVQAGIPDGAFDALSGDDKPIASAMKKRNKEMRAGQRSFGGDEQVWARQKGEIEAEAREISDLPEDAPGRVAEQRTRYEAYRQLKVAPAELPLDLWTAAFFWPLVKGGPAPVSTSDVEDALAGHLTLSAEQQEELERLRAVNHFFHWPLEFPEVFAEGGFDCVLGNPPWEKVEMDEQEFFAGRDDDIARLPGDRRKRAIAALQASDPPLWCEFQTALRAVGNTTKFVKISGRLPLTGSGRINLYALFAEQDRSLLKPTGRCGVVVPTGIATDDSTKAYFNALMRKSELVSFFCFHEIRTIFHDTDSRNAFGLFTLSGAPSAGHTELVFSALSTDHFRDDRRRFRLTAEDVALLNPNTGTCPIFRTWIDAELTRSIYRCMPVLINEQTGENSWGVRFMQGTFNMATDSRLFRDAPGPSLVPLYEGKLFHQYNHRWATYEGRDARDATPSELRDPNFRVQPRYWVSEVEVEARLSGRWDHQWLLAFRDITLATVERTTVLCAIPRTGVGHTAPIVFPSLQTNENAAHIVACSSSFVFDYVVRQKMAGIHLTYGYLNQVPALNVDRLASSDLDFIVPRVLELTYTAWDLKPFAEDLGYDGAPFAWDEERRGVLRAELDAYYAALYGLTRDELRYILDPQDVFGPDFPSETFRVLKERELRQLGEYRTRRLVLEAWDRLGLEPRNRKEPANAILGL